MGDRIIFRVNVIKDNREYCIGWLYQHWGASCGYQLQKAYASALKKLTLVGAAEPYQAVKALIMAGKTVFGGPHSISTTKDASRWDGKSILSSHLTDQYTGKEYNFPIGSDEGEIHDVVMAPNDELIAQHPELATVDAEPRFRVGTGNLYPDYIYGWCENAVDVCFDPDHPQEIQAVDERSVYRKEVVPAIRRNIKAVHSLVKPRRGKNAVLDETTIGKLADLPFVEIFPRGDVAEGIRRHLADSESSVMLVVRDTESNAYRAQTCVNLYLDGNTVTDIDWDGDVEFPDTLLDISLDYEVNERGQAVGELWIDE